MTMPDLLPALRLLARPGAEAVDAWIPEFGFTATFIDLPTGDLPIDASVLQTLIDCGYVIVVSCGVTAMRYQLTIAGAEALAEIEKEKEGERER